MLGGLIQWLLAGPCPVQAPPREVAETARTQRRFRKSRLIPPHWAGKAAVEVYHASTHSSLGQAIPQVVCSEGAMVVIYRAKVMWTNDADGRMRGLEELNLGRLNADLLEIRMIDDRGPWRIAEVVLRSMPSRQRFFLKD